MWYTQYTQYTKVYKRLTKLAPTVLSTFCGGGGADEGMRRGGVTSSGIDNVDQPEYRTRFGDEPFVTGDGCDLPSPTAQACSSAPTVRAFPSPDTRPPVHPATTPTSCTDPHARAALYRRLPPMLTGARTSLGTMAGCALLLVGRGRHPPCPRPRRRRPNRRPRRRRRRRRRRRCPR